MPLFNVDDKKIKNIIKSAVGAKEGDFNGQKMMCGTTVNPVVVVNDMNLLKKDRDAVYVQNVVYDVFEDDRLRKVVSIWVYQQNTETNDKNFVITAESLDGTIYSTGTWAVANNTGSYVVLRTNYNATIGLNISGTENLVGIYDAVMLKNLKIQVTSAVGTAQEFKYRVWYYE